MPLVKHLLVVIGYAGSRRAGPSLRERLELVVIPSMHLAWGAGFIGGAARGARENVDTSRTPDTPRPRPAPRTRTAASC
ncbi:MAG: hypothetical protein R2692_08090 [Microbacterium sp.]